MDNEIRVRIAPSPTGYLHVGTARTAIFNFLFARNKGGKFLIRIEDTDKERSSESLIKPILDSLKWLGMESDEEIIYQSHKVERHKEIAQEVLASSNAYRCFCTQEELQADREKARAEKRPPRYSGKCYKLSQEEIDSKIADGQLYALRLHIPDGETTYNDMVVDDVTRKNIDIEDFIIARSDGTAVYNLAVVVDDHDMKISDVIRGNDHITNTFKQIHIYKALGWDIPRFGHVPLILRPDKKKVSKRLGDKDVGEYSKEGILPGAMFNYLSLLGWSTKTEREIFTPKELVAVFTDKNFNSSNAVFDEEKLVAFNKEHIKTMPLDELLEIVVPIFVEEKLIDSGDLESQREYLSQVVNVLKERVRRTIDFVSLGKHFFKFDFTYDEKADEKQFTADRIPLMQVLVEKFSALEKFDHDSIEKVISDLAEEKEIKKAVLIHPTRLATSGMSVGPGLYDLLLVLGKDRVIERMKKAIEYIESK